MQAQMSLSVILSSLSLSPSSRFQHLRPTFKAFCCNFVQIFRRNIKISFLIVNESFWSFWGWMMTMSRWIAIKFNDKLTSLFWYSMELSLHKSALRCLSQAFDLHFETWKLLMNFAPSLLCFCDVFLHKEKLKSSQLVNYFKLWWKALNYWEKSFELSGRKETKRIKILSTFLLDKNLKAFEWRKFAIKCQKSDSVVVVAMKIFSC